MSKLVLDVFSFYLYIRVDICSIRIISMKRFTRTKEDFICEHCGAEVVGTGYTNHCPECLWSKHVDMNPGDRAASCGGMMAAVRVDTEKGVHIVVHRCVRCGHTKRNKVSPADNYGVLLEVIQKYVDQ